MWHSCRSAEKGLRNPAPMTGKVRLANELSPNRLRASRQEAACSIFTTVSREKQIKAWKVEEQYKYCN